VSFAAPKHAAVAEKIKGKAGKSSIFSRFAGFVIG
jgi:hypothetical protein